MAESVMDRRCIATKSRLNNLPPAAAGKTEPAV